MATTGAALPARAVDEHRAWLRTERQLVYARLVAAAIGALNLAVADFSGPTWTIALAWGGCLAITGLSLLVLGRIAADGLSARLADTAAWAETLGLGLLLPAATDEHTAFVILMIVLMSVLASLRDGRRGLARALAVGIALEFVRSTIALATVDHVHLEDSLTGIALAAAVGAVVGHVADLSRARADHAQDAAAQLELQRQVVLAGIGAHEEDALTRMATTLADGLGAASVTIVLRDEDGRPEVVATTDEAIAHRMHPEVLPDGPLDRTMNHGEVALASPEVLEQLGHMLPRRGSASTAPLRRGRTVIGALCIDTPPGVELGPEKLATIGDLADQMSLVIEAARSYDRKADLAAQYRELDRLKTDFIAITSHELRTPLTTVLGVIETMRQRAPELTPQETARLLDALSRQAGRLARLVDDLATVSRVDAGTLVTVPRPTDVAAVLHDAVAALPDVPTDVQVTTPLPRVAADPDRLLQVVTNLVVNGDQHGDGVVHVHAEDDGDGVVVRVWDDGPGIPADRRDDVFDRFVRLGDTRSHSRGSGLGLAIARELTEAMGGSIDVVDLHGRGAFEVRLPLAVVPA